MIEVIRKGPPVPIDQKYELQCKQCKSLLNYRRSDIKQLCTQHFEFAGIICPNCDYKISINSEKPIPII